MNIPAPVDAFHAPTVDGTQVLVRRYGNPDGPRMLVSHGNAFAADAYYPFWSLFADRFDIFVYDIRNHGRNRVGEINMHTLPVFIDDFGEVMGEIGRRFGARPVIGVFHSLSTVTALHRAPLGGFSALVMFDPPLCPAGRFPDEMMGVGERLAAGARKRQDRFDSPDEFAELLAGHGAFRRLRPDALRLFASASLRATEDGYELACPREYEARIYQYVFCWTLTVELEAVPCPMKVIGADPTVRGSYMPGTDLSDIPPGGLRLRARCHSSSPARRARDMRAPDFGLSREPEDPVTGT